MSAFIVILVSVITNTVTANTALNTPVGHVETGSPEAIYIPAGWTGPIVAAPFDEIIFETQ